jgi:hypothetical protein
VKSPLNNGVVDFEKLARAQMNDIMKTARYRMFRLFSDEDIDHIVGLTCLDNSSFDKFHCGLWNAIAERYNAKERSFIVKHQP